MEAEFKSVGSVIEFIKYSDLSNFRICMPNLSEQQKIAEFLDDKCGAIDEIISKTEQSIEEYKKLKQRQAHCVSYEWLVEQKRPEGGETEQ